MGATRIDAANLAQQDLGLGLGLRSAHYHDICSQRPDIGFFEILSDNYMHTGGRPVQMLDRIAAEYRVVMHGVGLGIGNTDAIDRDYVHRLAELQRRCGALWISDHLCWTAIGGRQLHDLMPLPYTDDVLAHLIERVGIVQDMLQQPLVLENASTYVQFAGDTLDEPNLLRELAAATGCGLLLDVNNVFVCARNHGLSAEDYLRRMPWQNVVCFHIAGHSELPTHLLDTHDTPVCAEVWQLYEQAFRLSGGRPTVLERDDNLPSFADLHAEASLAIQHQQVATP